uniref:NADH dehydrogenase subunit 6 n=1 Tax=Polypogon tarsicrinata TaxID=1341273 RepID=UPI002114C762|nr:NADH dehydrogenase subunit 6 [Polypogon tarsicrinata]UTE83787.1 NADH dehydrogenase subunit 6 [Polypogon tarsicrinata]
MTKMLLSYFIIFISFFMMFLNNPLSMGLMILIQTLLICLMTGMLIKTYWFSYILFLTFMGGILVLFIYVCSIASNELFKPSFNMKLIFIFSLLFFFLIYLIFKNNLFWMNFSFNSDMNNFMIDLFINNENKMNLTKLYNNQTFMIMLMLMIYLFITLIVVVKITNIFYGPIRSNI